MQRIPEKAQAILQAIPSNGSTDSKFDWYRALGSSADEFIREAHDPEVIEFVRKPESVKDVVSATR